METSENPGLPRLSPRPHTEALGTRLDKTLTIYINFGKFKLEKAPNFVTKPASNVDRRTPFGSEKKCGMHISVKCVVIISRNYDKRDRQTQNRDLDNT
jgi:hypothetical protein